eukprot:2638229-Alexandrium_andersonii.AAC.1
MLVGQLHWVIHGGSQQLWDILGPNLELLVWIPKKGGDPRPEGQRPLMLPTCLHRIAEAAVVSIVGPLAEPTLS